MLRVTQNELTDVTWDVERNKGTYRLFLSRSSSTQQSSGRNTTSVLKKQLLRADRVWKHKAQKTRAEREECMKKDLCLCCSGKGHLAKSCPKKKGFRGYQKPFKLKNTKITF